MLGDAAVFAPKTKDISSVVQTSRKYQGAMPDFHPRKNSGILEWRYEGAANLQQVRSEVEVELATIRKFEVDDLAAHTSCAGK